MKENNPNGLNLGQNKPLWNNSAPPARKRLEIDTKIFHLGNYNWHITYNPTGSVSTVMVMFIHYHPMEAISHASKWNTESCQAWRGSHNNDTYCTVFMLQIPLHNTLLTLPNAGKSIALVKLCLLGHEIMKQPLWDEFGIYMVISRVVGTSLTERKKAILIRNNQHKTIYFGNKY